MKAADANGNGVPGVTVAWAVGTGGGKIENATTITAANGQAATVATVGARGPNSYTATAGGLAGSPITFSAIGTAGLVYTDPPPGGKIRLVAEPSSPGSTVALKLVANQTLTGYFVGFNLPLDSTKVRLNVTPLTSGTALPPGSSPAAAKAALPTSGPFKGVLVSGQSQKAAGIGAVVSDSTVAVGDVFYVIKLDAIPSAGPGVVFDGANRGAGFSGGLRNKSGTDVVVASDFAIGKLELR